MSKNIISILLLLLLYGCSVTTVTDRGNQIVINIENKSIKIDALLEKKYFHNFGNLYLTQKILKRADGSNIVYEKIRLDMQYEFNFSTTTTIQYIFETERSYKIYANRGLYIYQLLLSNGEVLNLIAEEFEDQSMTLIYGMSSSDIRDILNRLDDTAPKRLIDRVVILPNSQDAMRSIWNTQKIHFIPLIVPSRLVYPF